MEIQQNVHLAPFTSWQVGGFADYFCTPRSQADVVAAMEFSASKKIPFHVLGGGSNVLISDDGVEGLVICLKYLNKYTVHESPQKVLIEAQAGVSKSELLKTFLKHQLAPAEFLAGLPGDVGGGIVMNAGVAESLKPREFGEIVEEVEVLRWNEAARIVESKIFLKNQIDWSYRHSQGWGPGIIVNAKLSWENKKDPKIIESVRNLNKIRLQKQPLDMPSCGSVFVNPSGYKAAQLIDQCGLKGFQVGQAQVSQKHANFIINLGGAKASDIKAVISHVKKVVKEKQQVDLKTEVVWMGR